MVHINALKLHISTHFSAFIHIGALKVLIITLMVFISALKEHIST